MEDLTALPVVPAGEVRFGTVPAGCPHFMQNAVPGGSGEPQFMQKAASPKTDEVLAEATLLSAPHLTQNSAPGERGAPQLIQYRTPVFCVPADCTTILRRSAPQLVQNEVSPFSAPHRGQVFMVFRSSQPPLLRIRSLSDRNE